MIEYQALTKFLSEKQAFLWASLFTGVTLFVLSRNGYADHLEKSVVTTIIAGGMFAGFLLVCMGFGWAIERGKRSRAVQAERKNGDAQALRFFDDMFHEHEVILQYVATEFGKPRFKAGVERDLIAMMDLGLIEYDGPAKMTSGATYYKVRDVVWERMVAQGYLNLKKWEEDWPPPWEDNQRI